MTQIQIKYAHTYILKKKKKKQINATQIQNQQCIIKLFSWHHILWNLQLLRPLLRCKICHPSLCTNYLVTHCYATHHAIRSNEIVFRKLICEAICTDVRRFLSYSR